jgi:acyl carrier protein
MDLPEDIVMPNERRSESFLKELLSKNTVMAPVKPDYLHPNVEAVICQRLLECIENARPSTHR